MTEKSTEKVSTRIVPFFSRLNDRELPYCAILPENYENSNEKFAVLYLLHGLFGRFDNWITNTKLTHYVEDFPFIIICAEGGDSWWTDNSEIENHFFESYITQELIPDVEKKFRAGTTKKSRTIAGLSMGGYGAFKLALRQPKMFCFAASTSGAFHAAEIYENQETSEWNELKPSILKVFSSENHKIREQMDLFQMANDFPSEQISELPFFYFDCGADDSFLPVNLRLAEIFRRRKIPHEFHKFPGAHDWNYWNIQIQRILQTAKINLKP